MEKLSKKLQDILNEQDFCFTMEEMRTNAKDDGRLAPVRHGRTPNCGAKMDGETRE